MFIIKSSQKKKSKDRLSNFCDWADNNAKVIKKYHNR